MAVGWMSGSLVCTSGHSWLDLNLFHHVPDDCRFVEVCSATIDEGIRNLIALKSGHWLFVSCASVIFRGDMPFSFWVEKPRRESQPSTKKTHHPISFSFQRVSGSPQGLAPTRETRRTNGRGMLQVKVMWPSGLDLPVTTGHIVIMNGISYHRTTGRKRPAP